jgi:hypothetical protein
MNKFIIIFFFVCVSTTDSVAQHNMHIIKTDSKINALFKGEGFIFESVGYEYMLNIQHTIGLRIGWDVKTSKIEMNEEGKATTHRDLLFALSHYYFPYKSKYNIGMYVSPELYYVNGMLSVDNEKSQGYGLNLRCGYRLFFNRIVLDCALVSGYEYSYQRNDVYVYKSKEIKPLYIKMSVGFMF